MSDEQQMYYATTGSIDTSTTYVHIPDSDNVLAVVCGGEQITISWKDLFKLLKLGLWAVGRQAMSITDELREWASRELSYKTRFDELFAIADRIDAEHQKAEDEWKVKDGQSWLHGYGECHAELMEGNETIASDLESCGWVRLPKDADGEYIHIGDVMAYADNTKPMVVVALVPPAVFLTEDGPRYADMCRHYHAPTVEDVLEELLREYDRDDSELTNGEIIERFAARLRLREDA